MSLHLDANATRIVIPGTSDFSRKEDFDHALASIERQHYCFLPAHKMKVLVGAESLHLQSHWRAFQESWDRLGQDHFMRDGGRYRKRRHAVYSARASGTPMYREPDQPHYQSRIYNPLNGGIARHYLPIEETTAVNPVFTRLMSLCSTLFGHLRPEYHWHIEVHQFRIEATGLSDGRPTPEGVHRDGVDFVFMLMVHRQNVIGGETEIYNLDGIRLDRFTLTEQWDAAIVNDRLVRHGVTPIFQIDARQPGIRDVLVVTFRCA